MWETTDAYPVTALAPMVTSVKTVTCVLPQMIVESPVYAHMASVQTRRIRQIILRAMMASVMELVKAGHVPCAALRPATLLLTA